MSNLPKFLAQFIRGEIDRRHQDTEKTRDQIIFIGPPSKWISETFTELELINSTPPYEEEDSVYALVASSGVKLSSESGLKYVKSDWPYAVSLRNKGTKLVILCDPLSWSTVPASIANSSDRLGSPSIRQSTDALKNLWNHLDSEISDRISVSLSAATSLREVAAAGSERTENQGHFWQSINKLLGTSSEKEARKALGILKPSDRSQDPWLADQTLRELARYCAENGFDASIHSLQNSGDVGLKYSAEIKELLDALREYFGGSSEFADYAIIPHRIAAQGSWWEKLDQGVVSDLMQEVRPSRPKSNLGIIVKNGVFASSRNEPIVVAGPPEFEITTDGSIELDELKVARRLSLSPVSGGSLVHSHIGVSAKFIDDELPMGHGRAPTYTFSAPESKDARIEVLPLETFSTMCTARVPLATRIKAPRLDKKNGSISQEIEVEHHGPHVLEVYASTAVHTMSLIWRKEALEIDLASLEAEEENDANVFRFKLEEIDDTGEYLLKPEVSLGTAEDLIVELKVPDESYDRPSTLFGSLLMAHARGDSQERQPRVSTGEESRLSRMFIANQQSWKGLALCLHDLSRIELDPANWKVTNGIEVQSDLRPPFSSFTPPNDVVAARDTVRNLIDSGSGRIEDFDLSEPKVRSAIEDYCSSYFEWLKSDYNHASWMDIVAVHGVEGTGIDGQPRASREPQVVLMSPMHPIRIGWQSNAQKLLREGMSIESTPAAALIDPHSAPGVISLPLFEQNSYLYSQSFKAVKSSEPHWLVLVNPTGNTDSLQSVLAHLNNIGFKVGSLSGSFTLTQSKRALEDASEQLSGRAQFTIGLSGDGRSSAMLEEGVLGWVEDEFATIANDPAKNKTDWIKKHDAARVIDLRDHVNSPNAERLSATHDLAGRSFQWFTGRAAASLNSRFDVALVNELETSLNRLANPGIDRFYSAITPGNLLRLDVRSNVASTASMSVSLVSSPATSGAITRSTIDQLVQHFENVALDKNNGALVVIPTPDLKKMFDDLKSKFVAVTSTAVDPGGFMRVANGMDKILWDFELPVPDGLSRQSAGVGGYYLLAEPSEGLMKRLRAACEGVGITDKSDIDSVATGILEDVKVLGIPILRRIGRSSSSSRGEIGVVLASRLLLGTTQSKSPGLVKKLFGDKGIEFLVPVDSFWPITKLFKPKNPKLTDSHPDLLLIRLIGESNDRLHITCSPIEVKYRTSSMNHSEVQLAVAQARNMAKILTSAWSVEASEFAQMLGRYLLGMYVDHGFRTAKTTTETEENRKAWAIRHSETLQNILSGEFDVDVVSPGFALVFDSSSTTADDYDEDEYFDGVKFSQDDIRSLLVGEPVSDIAEFSVDRVLKRLIVEAQPTVDDSPKPQVDHQEPEPANPTDVDQTEPELSEDQNDNGNEEVNIATSSDKKGKFDLEQVEHAFNSFVGNKHAIDRIKIDLMSALMSDPPSLPRNYLLTGLPSTGKTELAKRISDALGMPFVRLDGRGLTNRERLFDLIDGLIEQHGSESKEIGVEAGLPVLQYPPITVFIDEIHLASTGVQESLLTTLEADDRSVTLRDRIALVGDTTFIFATTRASGLDLAFRSRCIEIELEEYSISEVATILKIRHPHDWPENVYTKLSQWGRAVPREALSLAVDLETRQEVANYRTNGQYDIEREAELVRATRRIDANGLGKMHYEFLKELAKAGRPIGIKALANLMDTIDEARIEDEIEPVLVKRGLVARKEKGRRLTAEGREYLENNSYLE